MRQGSEPFDQDSGYALAVAGDGLALVTLGSTTGGASALVDAGSRDFWNDGITATGAPEAGHAQIDNPTQAQADNPALAIGDGEVAVAHGDGPEDVMDIGYHYLGAMRFPSISFPVEYDETLFLDAAEDQLISLSAEGNDGLVLLSPGLGALDDRVGQTYAFVPANEEIEEAHFPYEHEDGYRLGGLVRFGLEDGAATPCRFLVDGAHGDPGDTAPDGWIEDPYGIPPRARGGNFDYDDPPDDGPMFCDSLAITLLAGTCAPFAMGREQTSTLQDMPLYLATVGNLGIGVDIEPGGASEILVWRSMDLGETWELIGARLAPWHGTPAAVSDHHTAILDVALAANDTDLWVFWIEDADDPEVMESGLFGARIPDAAGRAAGNFAPPPDTGGLTAEVFAFGADQPGSYVRLFLAEEDDPQDNTVTVSQPQSLDARFDFAWADENTDVNDGTPVITYLSETGAATVVRVELNDLGEIVGIIGTPQDLTDSGVPAGESQEIQLAVNDWAIEYEALEDFSLIGAFRHDASAGDRNTWRREARTDGTTDTWESTATEVTAPLPEALDDPDARRNIDVTYRFDGRSRPLIVAAFDGESHIVTPTGAVARRNPVSQAITSNALNLTDTYVADQDLSHLTITRIDP